MSETLDKNNFIKLLKIEKPKKIDFEEFDSLFGKRINLFRYGNYIYQTPCIDCRFTMEEKIKELGKEGD